jgi:hypothetical protein
MGENKKQRNEFVEKQNKSSKRKKNSLFYIHREGTNRWMKEY